MDIVDPFDQPTAKRGIVDPFDAPTPVSLMGPMAADAAAIAPLAKADPNADSIGKAFQSAQDVGSTLASRLTPAAMLPMIAGGGAGIGSLASEKPVGNGLADMFLPAPIKMGMALANPDAVSRAADAVTRTEEPLNYQPQTDAGKVAAAVPDYVFNKIGQAADYVGDKAMNVPVIGGPALATLASTAVNLGPLLLADRAVRGGIGTAKAVRAADLSRGDPNIMANIDADMAGPSGTAIDTNPAHYGNSLGDMLTKGATDTQAPTAADSLKNMAAQVKGQIAQNLQPVQPAPETPTPPPATPPVQGARGPTNPPPAVAQALNAATGGDKGKMAQVIQGAVGDKLLPGETPENLAQAAKDQANAANLPVEPKPGDSGEGTGVDSAANAPEAAARAAVLAEKPDAAPPLHPWTPVETAKPIPLAGGVIEPAKSGEGQTVAIDPRIPQHVDVDGVKVDAHEAIGVHERTEKTLMEQGLSYSDAHDLATKAENAFVAKKYGIEPEKYQAALKPHIANALDEASNHPDIPPTLDKKPYADDGDEHLLKNDGDLTDVRNSYLKGLGDEIGWDQVGGKLLRAEVEPNSGALGEVTGRTTWEPKGRMDGNGQSGFWQNYKQREGANGLTIAGAKEALRKHLAGESLSPKERRFADFAEDQATKYMGEYAEEKAAGDTIGRQDAKESTHPPTDYSEYTNDYKPEDSQGGFTPQERHAARLNALLSKLGPITEEQRTAITAHHGNVELDPVMGLPTRKELVPTIEAAKAEGGPASYGEVDIRGVGSLNAHMGSNSAADPHLKAIAQIVQRNVDDAANAFGGRGVVVRKGGDELGVIAHGIDPADLHRALGRARIEVDAYAKQHGLDKAKSAKVGGQDGVGLHYGVSRITPDADVDSIISDADHLVESRKKGDIGYEHTGQTEAIGSKPSGGQAGRTVEGAGGGGSAGTGARGALSDSALETEPADAETAVAERPVTQAAKPPPTKPVEAAAETNPAKQEGTQVRNAAVDAQRDELGLDELPPAEREHWQDASDEARAGIANGDIHPRTLAAEVAAKPRALTTVETMALAHDLKSLSEERASAVSDALAARERGDTVAEAQALLRKSAAIDAMETNHAALRNGGTEAARSLSIRNAILKDDYTVGRNMDRAKLAYGDKFNDALRKQVETLSDELEKAQAEAARLQKAAEARQSARKPKMTDEEKTQARIQAQIDKLQKTIEERTRLCPI